VNLNGPLTWYIMDRLIRAKEDILLIGEDRLGPPDEATKAELNNITDLDRLKRLVRRAAKAVAWREILDTP
jgi:hypothetical protein